MGEEVRFPWAAEVVCHGCGKDCVARFTNTAESATAIRQWTWLARRCQEKIDESRLSRQQNNLS